MNTLKETIDRYQYSRRIYASIRLEWMSTVWMTLFALALGVLGMACSSEPDNASEAVFLIEACEDQQFRVLIRDADVIAEAEALIGAEQQRIVNGELRRGDGGFNAPYDWHLDPATVAFADATIEVCDGCPERIEDDLDYWIETVERFCPWTTRVVERER